MRDRPWRCRSASSLAAVVLRVVPLLVAVVMGGCRSAPTSAGTPTEIYDPRADGERQLSEALFAARQEGKRVLLNLGANWCGDSHAIHRLLQTYPPIQQEVQRHFVLVLVDVNRRGGAPRNAALVERFGDPLARGIPVLLILDPDGSLLNTEPSERLREDDHKYPEKVLAYLQKWAAKAQ